MSEKEYKVFEEEINLTKLINDISSRRYVYLGFLLAVTLISSIILISIPNEYTSTSVVSIKESSSSSSTGNSLGDIGSALNPLAVFSTNMGSSRKGYVLRLLKSRTFFEYHVKKNKSFLKELHAFKSFEKDSNINVFDVDIYNPDSETWNSNLFPGGSPSLLLSQKEFSSYFYIEEEDTLENYLTLKIQHESPLIAKRWLENLIISFNTYVREKEANEANLSLKYLNTVIAETNVPEVKGVIANLIKNQIKDLMITNVNDDYVLKIIDKPFLPEKKSFPDRFLFLISSIFISLFLILIFSLLFPKKIE
tara:strand:+ start:14036 stop:14959 length:924 start_codon:yes stop_codon:yes gene_type:complete